MKLVTWNTQWCRGLDGIVSPGRIVEHAKSMADFDVLCLQEIASGFDAMPGGPGDQPAEIAALLPGFAVFFGAAVDTIDPQGRRQRFGNLVATRLPAAVVEHHRLPWSADPSVKSMPRMCTVVTVDDKVLGPVRVMTTHLEYYSPGQRTAQARALRGLHAIACERTAMPPVPGEAATPFQPQPHTAHAVLCGDFNLTRSDAGFSALIEPFDAGSESGRWHDAWPLANGAVEPEPTFCLHDKSNGPEPIACDFWFVSDALSQRVRRMTVDTLTQVSDHQPVLLELD
ncbi:endonuclease/exonuclease/phosphatase family protein [soil metagenome]